VGFFLGGASAVIAGVVRSGSWWYAQLAGRGHWLGRVEDLRRLGVERRGCGVVLVGYAGGFGFLFKKMTDCGRRREL